MTDDWKQRLQTVLEPLLRLPDPRPRISTYHDMPYAIFHYPPEEEFSVRVELSMLRTRLEQSGKRVTVISLAECLQEALTAEGYTADKIAEVEISVGLDSVIETVHELLSEYHPLDELVISRMPSDPDPLRDIVFIVRAGALFPAYRTSALLEQLHARVTIPCILFYPGTLEGTVGLSFMGVCDPDHNYRPRIF